MEIGSRASVLQPRRVGLSLTGRGGVERHLTRRVVVFVWLLAAAWLVMTTTHELGHIVGGWLGGARLVAFELAPWRLPYSLHEPDPHPKLTLWAGPVVGVVLPLIAAAIARQRWAWFIADFCLIANGGYLALGWLAGDRFLDTPRLLAAGVHPATLAAFCLVTILVGYFRFRADCLGLLSPHQPRNAERMVD